MMCYFCVIYVVLFLSCQYYHETVYHFSLPVCLCLMYNESVTLTNKHVRICSIFRKTQA